ncbi:MAG: glycosyltransferase family 39 protein [candidate division Zixibacteria bacterium]|nr:glycosyltransferase family 39 protein [Candidatus Tariuqbacter arcticus]
MKSKTDYLPWLIIALSLIVRLVYLSEITPNNPYFHDERLVAETHHQWAKDILSGNASDAPEPFIRAPLYPYLLAGIYWLFGANMLYPRLIQLLVSALMTYFIYLSAKRVFDRKSGIAAGIIWALFGPEIFFAGEMFETSLTAALIFAVYLTWVKGEDSKRIWWYLSSGILLGLAVLMKPNSAILLPLLLIWYFWKREKAKSNFKPALVFTAGCLALILTVTARNAIISGEFVPVAAYGGLNIYIGNNPEADGVSAILPQWEETEDDRAWGLNHHATALTALSVRKAGELTGTDLSAAESSRYWWKETAKFALENPGKFVLLNLKKFTLFFSGYEYGNTRDLYFSRNYSSILSILLWNHGIKFPFGLLLPFAGLGVFFVFREKLPGRGTLILFLIGAVISVTIFFVCARFRMNAVPFLIILAGGGIIGTFKDLNGKKIVGNLAVFIPLLLLVNINFFGLEKDVSFQEHYNLGQFYLEKGEIQSGYDELLKSYLAKPDFVPALNSLGLIYETAGKFQEAAHLYRQALNYSVETAAAHYNLGAALGKAGSIDSAIVHLNKAVEIDSTMWTAWLNLGNAHYFAGNPDSAEVCYMKVIELEPYNPDVLFNLGNLQIALGDTAAALEYLHRAAGIEPDYPSLNDIIERLTGAGY